MQDSEHRILEMLAQNKITVDEAERLLTALRDGAPQSTEENRVPTITGSESNRNESHEEEPQLPRKQYRFLRVEVKSDDDNVNVKIPLQLLRSGIKLASLLPDDVFDKMNFPLKDIDFKNLSSEAAEELIQSLGEFSVDVNEDGGDTVRVFCE